MIASDAIQRAQEHGKTLSFEMAMSTVLFGIGGLEHLEGLMTTDQKNRVRQLVVRLSNLERRLSRG